MTIMIMTMVNVDDYDNNNNDNNNIEDTRRQYCNNHTYNNYSTRVKENNKFFDLPGWFLLRFNDKNT